jgi:uncharacterized membrane protein
MAHLFAHLRARPRMAISLLAGIAVALLLPGARSGITHALLGWNVFVWLYLVQVGAMMLRADHGHLRRVAAAQAEGAAMVLIVVCLASVASLVGVVVELSAAKLPGSPHALPHVLLALGTVAGSWLLLPTVFTLAYASAFYRVAHGSGLQFPSAAADFCPDYVDFLYFAITIAVASQTADVAVTSAPMRRLVLTQSLLSFAFNTAILAFTVNIAASMF